MARKLLRLPAVMERTGLSRSAIHALMKRGLFPRSVRIGARAVAWVEDEIDHFIRTRPLGGSERPR